ncbi:MAG: hypothetical protein V4857_28280 [Pseudomonadota bacterium]
MKNLLLVGLRYHSYTDEIAKELGALGYRVSFHEIQPRSLAFKTMRVVTPGLYQRRLDRHHARIIAHESGRRYDVVMFIQVHQFSIANIEELKRQHAGSKFVLYNWDAVSNHDYRPYIKYFDQVYTFDPQDAIDYGVNYLPLFCIAPFQRLAKRRQDERAIYFVGNIVSVQRYLALRDFKRHCTRNGIKFHCFMACSMLVLTRLLRRGILPTDVSFGSIAHPEFIAMIENSIAVFDFANHQQTGYTMRTIENLCAGKKLITNNPRIVRERFYSDDRILLIDNLDFSEVKQFMEKELAAPDEQFSDFHIQNFLKVMVG